MAKKSGVIILLGFLFAFLLNGCMGKGNTGENRQAGAAIPGTVEVPVYTRECVRMQMAEGYYAPSSYSTETDFSREGAFYYVRGGDDLQEYSFYFQPYFSTEKPVSLFEKEGGYMRDLSVVKREDGMHFCLLWVDEAAAHVSDYDEKGKMCREITVEGQGLETPGKWPVLRALCEDGYLIGLDDRVYLVQADGTLEHTVSLQDGQVRNLVETGDGRRFAVYQDLTKNQNGAAGDYGITVSQLDMEKNDACKNKNRVGSSTAGGVPSVEVPESSSANTMGRFWIFEEYLREDIWETEKYCWTIMLEKPIDGYTGLCYPITDECKEMLRGQMDSAVGVTKAQNDIYGMFLEEMDGYLNGNKDLDACCDILQNRVRLYLME